MATITRRPCRNSRGFSYRVEIRRKGHPPLSRSFQTRRDATQWAREQDTEATLSRTFADARGRNKTLTSLIDRYMADYEGRDHSRVARLAWWREKLGATKLPAVTPDMVADALDNLRADFVERNGQTTARRRSEATLNRYHAALSAVYQHALKRRWGWVKANPCRLVERGTEGKGRDRYLSDDERTRLLDACRGSSWPGLYPLVILALSTGARKGELLHLRWRDLDLAKGRALVRDTKNGEPKALPLLAPVRKTLREYAHIRRIDSGLLFPAVSRPENPRYADDHWRAAIKAANLKDFRFHDLRHSCASYLAMNGATAVEIADVLGHKTLVMVQRYSHLADQHKAELLERVVGPMLD